MKISFHIGNILNSRQSVSISNDPYIKGHSPLLPCPIRFDRCLEFFTILIFPVLVKKSGNWKIFR